MHCVTSMPREKVSVLCYSPVNLLILIIEVLSCSVCCLESACSIAFSSFRGQATIAIICCLTSCTVVSEKLQHPQLGEVPSQPALRHLSKLKS